MRIISVNKDFRELSSQTFFENDYVEAILSAKEHLFPSFYCGRFSPSITSDYGTAQPDLVLIDKDLRYWLVVEVELEHHSLSGHVEPQIRRLANGYFDDSHAMVLSNLFSLDFGDMKRLVRNLEPTILVIVPEVRRDWEKPLRTLGAKLMVFQIFETSEAHRAYLVEGEEPEVFHSDQIGIVTIPPGIENILEFRGISRSLIPDRINIEIEGRITQWQVHSTATSVLLTPNGRFPINPKVSSRSFKVRRISEDSWKLEKL